MGHPCEKRLHETLNQCYYHPKLCRHIGKLKCKDCQKHKLAARGYGLLPEQEVRISPWEEVAINLIGPRRVKVNGQQVEFNALTCIATSWVKIEKKVPADFLQTFYGLPADFPDFTSFA
jgi:hypothetical protein